MVGYNKNVTYITAKNEEANHGPDFLFLTYDRDLGARLLSGAAVYSERYRQALCFSQRGDVKRYRRI
ncbi:hypothetical protein D3C85_1807940 [compost metagenome]